MSLQLILGGAGSGKTTYVYDKIIEESLLHPEQLYYIIVPEQFTMQTQKDIVTRHPRHGTMNIDIVSFQRLAYRIFEELSVEQLSVLDDMGKSMVLRKVVGSCKKQLVLFQGHLRQTGFIGQLKTTISEFYQYGITPDILQKMEPEANNPRLKQKLKEFSVIFRAFQEYIDGHYITTEQILDVLCRVLPESELIKNSVIVLDGYAGFMPVQYRLLEQFMIHAKQVIVTVTADKNISMERPLGMQNLFAMSSQLMCRIKKTAEKNQIKVLKKIWLDEKNYHVPELAFMEKNLFRYKKAEYAGELDGGLELYQALNPAGEVAWVVHRIHKFVKQEHLRFRDIAVVTGDLENYGKEIAHQFELNQIPCFLDDKRTMLDNPLVEMIRAALEVVQRDFSYESVFRYLRSGMITDDIQMLDRLENYVLAMGIHGNRRWKETWEYTYRGGSELNLVELNAFKDQMLAPLFYLLEEFRQEDLNIKKMTEAVKQLLEETAAKERMAAYEEYFTNHEELRLAKEYSQIYDMVQELFSRLSDLLGEETVSRKDYAEILDAGFAEMKVGVIPETVDRVVVGDIMRTRLAHIKMLFFVGVNDGIVPSRKEGGSLLTDPERVFFSEHELELAPTAREDSFQQRFFLYRMMTKPTRKLLVSYSGVGGDGSSRRPSYLIGDLQKLFPTIVIQESERHEENAKILALELYSLEEARAELIRGLWKYRELKNHENACNEEEHKRFLELYRWFASDETRKEELERLLDAAFYVYQERGIGRTAAQLLYGKILSGSVTRLEQFAECAYAHFLKYGLELMERQQYEIKAADIGTMFHNSIDRCFKQVKENQKDWKTLTDEERTRMVSDAVKQVVSESGGVLESSSRNAFLAKRVEQITQRTVWALQQQLLRGDFEPAGFEVSFSAADHLQAMKIALSEEEQLHLRGRIDRLDLCEDEEHVYVKIIDYKSGSTSFDLMALYYGLQLQLVVYMDAVMELTERKNSSKEVVPAGIFYYNIADPVTAKSPGYVREDGTYDTAAIEQDILHQLKMNGLVNAELEVIRHMDNTIQKESDIIPVVLKNEEIQEGRSSVASRERFEALRNYVHEKLKETGNKILSGDTGIAPYRNGNRTACDYCPYHAVCGFDKKTKGYEYHSLKKKNSEEIWEEICQ